MLKKYYVILGLHFLSLFVFVAHAEQYYQIESSTRQPINPRVTIVTSVFNCDEFIEGFLKDIVQQTIFNECELLMINANSPGNEEEVIRRYMEQYPNITYVRLDEDPGLYGVWNLGIRMARSEYVTNANTDDRLSFNCYALHLQALDEHLEVDLVYSDYLQTKGVNESIDCNTAYEQSDLPEFEPGYMGKCLPNNHPMWRILMHEKYGYFDESYFSAGDWEMWCRAVEGGSLFKKVPGRLSLVYHNPEGLSTNRKKMKLIIKEREKVDMQYGYFFYDNAYFIGHAQRNKQRNTSKFWIALEKLKARTHNSMLYKRPGNIS